MSLKDPSKKMSKSDDDVNGAVLLTDTPEVITKKIAGATTDSGSAICFDQTRPGIYNLLVLYEVFSGKSRVAIEAEFAGQGYATFKKALAELVVASLTPLQKKYIELMKDPAELDRMLVQGAGKISHGGGNDEEGKGESRLDKLITPPPSMLRGNFPPLG